MFTTYRKTVLVIETNLIIFAKSNFKSKCDQPGLFIQLTNYI